MWDKLRAHRDATKGRRIEALMTNRPGFVLDVGEMRLDYAKTNIDGTAMGLLIDLLDETDVAGRREAMFSGEKINETEGRAVLHTALRNLDGAPVIVDGECIGGIGVSGGNWTFDAAAAEAAVASIGASCGK